MTIPTITRDTAPDLGPIPSEVFKAPSKLVLLLPLIFWTALAVICWSGWLKKQRNEENQRLTDEVTRQLAKARDEEASLVKQWNDLSARATSAARLSAWLKDSPMLQPVVVAVMNAVNAGTAKVNSVQLDRKATDQAVFILSISFVGDGTGAGPAIAAVRKNLEALGWKYTENDMKPSNNNILYNAFISP